MFAASDLSCAAKGVANPASKQRVKAEASRVSIASVSHNLAGFASSLSGPTGCDLGGKPPAGWGDAPPVAAVLTLALTSVCGSIHGILGSSSFTATLARCPLRHGWLVI